MTIDRLKWKPHQPLSILLLRVYQLRQPMVIPYHHSYGGCKSWIDLLESISLERLEPVLDDDTYAQKTKQIVDLLET